MKKISFLSKIGTAVGVALFPIVTFATENITSADTVTDTTAKKTLATLISDITYYLNIILGLFMAFAIVIFVFYVIKYFIMPNEDRKQAGSYVMYSLIGFFVLLSFWGLVNVVQNTFGLENSSNNNWQQINSIFPKSS